MYSMDVLMDEMRQTNEDGEVEFTEIRAHIIEDMYIKGLVDLNKNQMKKLSKGEMVRFDGDFIVPERPFKSDLFDSKWIDPIDAVRLLAPYTGDEPSAKRFIAKRIRGGIIRCCCIWMSIGRSNNSMSLDRPPYSGEFFEFNSTYYLTPVGSPNNPVEVAAACWNESDDWERDVQSWNWAQGVFATKRLSAHYANHRLRGGIGGAGVMLHQVIAGVRLDRQDIQKIIDSFRPAHLDEALGGTDIKLHSDKPRGKGGRYRDDKWENWIAEVVLAAYVKDLDWNGYRHEFYDQINEFLQERQVDGPARTTVQRAMTTIYHRLTEATNSGEIERRSPKR